MDLRPPFATGAERLRLLYRLPLTGRESRILVIGTATEAASAFDPGTRSAVIEVVVPGEPVRSSAFDVVALPGALAAGNADPLPRLAPVAPERLLALAYSALRPGGIVIGHLDHLLSVHGLRGVLRGRVGLGPWLRGWPIITGPRCQDALVKSGFEAPECFYVEPQIAAPMAIVPVHPVAARSHFLRAIRRTRGQYSPPGYALRLALAGVRLGGALQPHLFFWARRPC